jgi:hypothetical protein
MAKFARIFAIVILCNFPLSTIWYNYYDAQMVFLKDKFQKEEYWQVKANTPVNAPVGIETIYSGGIFAQRDSYLSKSGVYHRCKWFAYERTGEDRVTSTFCIFFWTPVPTDF